LARLRSTWTYWQYFSSRLSSASPVEEADDDEDDELEDSHSLPLHSPPDSESRERGELLPESLEVATSSSTATRLVSPSWQLISVTAGAVSARAAAKLMCGRHLKISMAPSWTTDSTGKP